jgi:hypothetical protein
MATTVDEILVRIEADMSDLRRDINKATRHVDQSANKMSSSFKKVGTAIAAIGGAAALIGFTKGVIATGIQVDNLQIKMRTLFGSAEDGAKAFDMLDKFAGKVPFSLREISAGAGPLAVVANDVDDMNQLLQITGNISALTGRSFNEIAGQIQKAMSAGINSAEILRDDGIKAMLGFKDGVAHSVADTVKRLQEGFGIGGEFDGLMDDMAKTAGGAMSMVGDAFFQMQKAIFSAGLGEAVIKLSVAFRNLLIASTPILAVMGQIANVFATVLVPVINALASSLEILAPLLALLAVRFVALKVAALAGAAANKLYAISMAEIALQTALAGKPLGRLMKLKLGFKGLVTALGPILKTFRGIIGKLIPVAVLVGIIKIVDGLMKIWNASKDVSDMFKNLKEVFKLFVQFGADKFDEMKHKVVSIGLRISQLVANITFKLKELIVEGMNKLITQYNSILRRFGLDSRQVDPMQAPDQSGLQEASAKLTASIEKEEAAAERAKISLDALKKKLVELGVLKPMEATIQSLEGDIGKIPALTDLVDVEAQKMATNMQVLVDGISQIGDGVVSTFRQMLDGAKFSMDDMVDLVKAAVRDMIAQLFRLAIVNNMINAMFGGVAGFEKLPSIPLLAGGGTLQRGQPTIVGERGPELIVPNSSGTVLNNHETSRALGGGGATVVNQTINVETGVSQTVRAEMISLLPKFKKDTMAAVLDAKRRGGTYGKAFA